MKQHHPIPVYLLSGFLGSGKTTFLTNMLDLFRSLNMTPAVLMNELGEVNLDGLLVKRQVAMAEMLGGCICCSMKGDLSLELNQLLEKYSPDVIIVESTGAAHPMETIDALTETAMYQKIELKHIITIADGHELLQQARRGKSKTFRLMQDQIRCGSLIVLNKMDKLSAEDALEAKKIISELNPYGKLVTTTYASLTDWNWLENDQTVNFDGLKEDHICESEDCRHNVHTSHDHVMSLTYYFKGKVDSVAFEQWLSQLPDHIYRAKGIVTFSDIPSRYLFQYAYKESDFMRIEPQGEVHDVAVFIGEHFDRTSILEQLKKLEED